MLVPQIPTNSEYPYRELNHSCSNDSFEECNLVGFNNPSDWVGVLLPTNARFIKVSRSVGIKECNEELVEIPSDIFSLEKTHPYLSAGAPYGAKSPFVVRKTILDKLLIAQVFISKYSPGTGIHIYDGYRPVAVQSYMVQKTFDETLSKVGLTRESASSSEINKAWERVFSVWALPSEDPCTPPPHSTGGVVDVGLIDSNGKFFDMGCVFDEEPPTALPFYFHFVEATPETASVIKNRELLFNAMKFAGFQRLPHEPWHFSYGDQAWAYLEAIDQGLSVGDIKAIYGRLE